MEWNEMGWYQIWDNLKEQGHCQQQVRWRNQNFQVFKARSLEPPSVLLEEVEARTLRNCHIEFNSELIIAGGFRSTIFNKAQNACVQKRNLVFDSFMKCHLKN